MDTFSVFLAFLTIVFVGVVLGINYVNYHAKPIPLTPYVREGFVTSASTDMVTKIRAVLDPMIREADPALCQLFDTIRNYAKEKEKEDGISDAEAAKRVEEKFALSIPGGALPCPLLVYPSVAASDLEWLDFLQKIPADFGARIIFMALYANETLAKYAADLRNSIDGNVKGLDVSTGSFTEAFSTEGFSSICPPDVITTRRAEQAAAGRAAEAAGCLMPEELSPEQIAEAVDELLKKLVATKESTLKAKGITPSMDIRPLIVEAKKNEEYLLKAVNQAKTGDLLTPL